MVQSSTLFCHLRSVFLYNLLAINWLEMSKNSNRRSNTPIYEGKVFTERNNNLIKE